MLLYLAFAVSVGFVSAVLWERFEREPDPRDPEFGKWESGLIFVIATVLAPALVVAGGLLAALAGVSWLVRKLAGS